MKYAVVTVVDGNFLIRSEWSNKDSAIQAFHSLCAALISDTGFSTAMVKVLDENLDTVDSKMEYIYHEPAPEPDVEPIPEPEPTEEESEEEEPTEEES